MTDSPAAAEGLRNARPLRLRPSGKFFVIAISFIMITELLIYVPSITYPFTPAKVRAALRAV